MGLLSTEVEVRLTGSNIKYYEDLGYEIPRYFNKNNNKYMVKRGTTILVKIKDLSKGSNILVDLSCDNCGKDLKWTYNDYNNRNHDGKCYCKRCGKIVFHSGENNNRWNPNLTNEERITKRNYPEYLEFIKSVLARDNYTCQCCGKNHSNEMEVHHLYGYSGFPEYRVDQTQAITLCKECHKAFHYWHRLKYGFENKGNCTREQYEKWLGNIIGKLKEYNGELIKARKVYDYDTGIIYSSAIECAKDLNTYNQLIYNCCNHKISTRKKKLSNGKEEFYSYMHHIAKGHHLFWLDEYNTLTKEEIEYYMNPNYKSNSKTVRKTRKIICTTTGEIFEQIKIAGEKYGLKNPYGIGEVCSGSKKKKSAGKLSDGTHLKWMYYEDFLKLPQEEQNEILSRNQESSSDGSFIM